MQNRKIFINQADHFTFNFGITLRSSAIFYYRQSLNFQTTISFMNYWKFKRGLNVAIIASVRDMSGKLIIREQLHFKQSNVINYRPNIGEKDFEGSVEIEVFSNENMVIPYAAIMGIYHSLKGISLVHSYTRTYSQHEVEEDRCISAGEESCWTVRDSKNIRSFAYIHNGASKTTPQTIKLQITRHDGSLQCGELQIPSLNPYETYKVIPENVFSNLEQFLEEKPGNMNISFSLNQAFTRMLVGNETRNSDDFQVTHSNFNYSHHITDKLDKLDEGGFMRFPSLGLKNKIVVVYPDSDPGEYNLTYSEKILSFNSKNRIEVNCDTPVIKFNKTDGAFPSRLVTALVVQQNPDRIPNECSLGVETYNRPPKKMWWGVCGAKEFRSKLAICHYPELYGDIRKDEKICIRLFSANSLEYLEKTISAESLPELNQGVYFDDLFSESKDFLNNDFGYFTVYSEYGGLACYSTLENADGSIAIEHGF